MTHQKRPIVALLTDFGTRDYFVAAMKARILSLSEPSAIVDISHEIAPHDIREAAFTLGACYRDFPKGTIFVAVVDPGVGSGRRPIVAESGEQLFVGPDNGIFSFVLQNSEGGRVFQIEDPELLSDHTSSTFHGRDLFAPAAAALVRGSPPSLFGSEINDLVRLGVNGPVRESSKRLTAPVLHVDRFGNLVLNLSPEEAGDAFTVKLGATRVSRVASHYAEFPDGLPFLILGSCGLYEISVFEGSAAAFLGAGRGAEFEAELS